MKNLLINWSGARFLVLLTLLLMAKLQFAEAANSAQCKVHNGTVIAVWQTVDINSNLIVVGATGSITNPSTWTVQTLSSGISNSNNSNPSLFVNANGDALAVWELFDSNNFYWVAASILPSGGTTWTSAVISDSNDIAGLYDVYGSIDASGNIFATWTRVDGTTYAATVNGNVATVSGLTWGTPFIVGF